MLPKHSNIKQIKKPIYVISILIISVIIFSILSINFYIGNRMAVVYAPMIDASVEMKYEVTCGHLGLEEYLSGDNSENLKDILERFGNAKWYISAMLNGGEIKESTL